MEARKKEESGLYFLLNWVSCFYIFVFSWYKYFQAHRFAQSLIFFNLNILIPGFYQ